MFLRNISLIFTLLFPATLFAATEFDSGLAPVELLSEFGGGTVYKSLPDNFPYIPLPADLNLRLIGSLDQFSTQRLLLRTTLGEEAIRERLRTAMTAAGWLELATASSWLSMCHDQHGTLQIRTSTLGGESRVHVTRSYWPLAIPQRNAPTCAQQQAAQQGGGSWFSYYLNLMPVLEVPSQTTSTATSLRPFASLSGSSSSSGTTVDMDRDGVIEVPDTTAAGLYAHFAAQMATQGWVKDSAGSGGKSATSVWYKTAAPPAFAGSDVEDIEFTGLLNIQNLAGNRYRVQFRMQALLEAGTGVGSSLSVRDFVPYSVLGNGTFLDMNASASLGIRGIPYLSNDPL